MPVYQLGNGDNFFDVAFVTDWSNGSSVFGGNGNDIINTNPAGFHFYSDISVDGGNGDDNILLDASNSVAFGNNGDDTIESIGGLGNTLLGGNGDDLLISVGGGSGMGPGNTLTGGLGHDTFTLVNDGNLVVANDAAGNGLVSNGDVFLGPMDVVTDYTQGEHIGLRQFDVASDGPAATDTPVARVDSVALASDPLPHAGDSFRPVVGSGDYALFHGTFGGINSFTVNASGPDLFVVYDTRSGPNELVGKGSLVLLGVSDTQAVAEALSSATAPGTASGLDFSDQVRGAPASAASGGHNSPAAAGFLDNGASGLSAMDLFPNTGSLAG